MELNFLTIADAAEDLQPLRGLLASFERNTQIQLSLRRVSWERAWQTLVLDAMEGKGPHVSQIGSTWGATMAMLDALRVFSEDDISSIGGAQAFLPFTWETVPGQREAEVDDSVFRHFYRFAALCETVLDLHLAQLVDDLAGVLRLEIREENAIRTALLHVYREQDAAENKDHYPAERGALHDGLPVQEGVQRIQHCPISKSKVKRVTTMTRSEAA